MALAFWIGLIVCILSAVAVGLTAVGSKLWSKRMTAFIRQIEAGRLEGTFKPPCAIRYDSRELEGLPEPVQRYFRAVLKDGQPVVSAVTIRMTGTINMSATAEKWKPFSSSQRVVARRPGFVWDAQISMLPGVTVRVFDSYIAGEGLLQAAMQGLFTVADMSGSELTRSEFMRFFAETPWYPTALLPSQGVRWAAVDATSATASMTNDSVSLSLLFHFNDAGLIDSVRAEARGSLVGDEIVMRPWVCGMSNYLARDGMTLPMSGTAGWVLPDGLKPYFHGSVQSLNYDWEPGRIV